MGVVREPYQKFARGFGSKAPRTIRKVMEPHEPLLAGSNPKDNLADCYLFETTTLFFRLFYGDCW
jgi:hypothetical protein